MKRSNLQLYFAIGLTIFAILPIIAPIFAYFGLEMFSDPIYGTYQFFCHQRPWRSYHMFDYQYAMDARMMFMFGTMAISSWILYFKNMSPLQPRYAFIWAVIFTIPLGLDGSIQALAELTSSVNELPFYESTNFTRSITGILFGMGFGFGMLPFLNMKNDYSKIKDYVIPVILTFVLSILILFSFVYIWFLTSSVYMPSYPMMDHMRRFPGYNYEITTGGGHSTINRLVQEHDIPKYVERAKIFERDDLIDDFYKNAD